MFENFLTILSQVAVLFVLIFIGFICGKRKIINESGAKILTDIVLYFATPCVIIKSFVREFDKALLGELIISMLISLLIHIGSIALVHIVFRKNESKDVMRFACVFSNAGYMALPLQQAILGDLGVFFGASFVAIFNVVLWTYGVLCMNGKKGGFSLKKLIFNPGIIGVVAGLLVFVFSVNLPDVVLSPITHIANLNTPLPMLIIGFYLSQTDFKRLFLSSANYIICAIRLIVIPVAALVIMYLCGVRSNMLVSMTIAASAPTAAATTMFAVRYQRNADLSVGAVSITTVISLITMPIIVAAALVLA